MIRAFVGARVLALAVLLPDHARGGVRLACDVHGILLGLELPRGVSARDVSRPRVVALGPTAGVVLVKLGRSQRRVLLTPEAVESLALGSGREVFAIIRATSIADLGAA